MTPTGSTGDDAGAVPDEVVSDLLTDECTRPVLTCLAAADGPMAVEDLARAVAARERGVEPGAVEDEVAREVRDDLFQRRLPRLTPTGLVAYDSLLGRVSLEAADERVRSALD